MVFARQSRSNLEFTRIVKIGTLSGTYFFQKKAGHTRLRSNQGHLSASNLETGQSNTQDQIFIEINDFRSKISENGDLKGESVSLTWAFVYVFKHDFGNLRFFYFLKNYDFKMASNFFINYSVFLFHGD